MRTLRAEAAALIAAGRDAFATEPAALAVVDHLSKRLDEPLRVAVAGKVKAGKSTLLNALVGEKLAPTDTGECTRIVTWYRDGHSYRVELYLDDDPDHGVQARFDRSDGAIEVDLNGSDAASIRRMVITWPSSGLRATTLIDTPGVGSLSEGVANKSFDFLAPEETETDADAVLYLMKHFHASDLRLLEAFHDTAVSQPNPVNAIAVLSRADEISGGRLDAMASARRIAGRYTEDHRLRRLVQVVVPVSGLLAETARTLTQAEFRWLSDLAAVPEAETELLLLSADRFVGAGEVLPVGDAERQILLERFGLFGVRLALSVLRRGIAATAGELVDQLVDRSGLTDLQRVLGTLFMDRTDVLKARSTVLALERLCEQYPEAPGVVQLQAELERVMAGAHPFRELASLAALRGGRVKGRQGELRRLEQVLGCNGTAPAQRLGLAADVDADELRTEALAQLSALQRRVENPLTPHDLAQTARVAIRTLEGMLV